MLSRAMTEAGLALVTLHAVPVWFEASAFIFVTDHPTLGVRHLQSVAGVAVLLFVMATDARFHSRYSCFTMCLQPVSLV